MMIQLFRHQCHVSIPFTKTRLPIFYDQHHLIHTSAAAPVRWMMPEKSTSQLPTNPFERHFEK
jgi:hypothetical protein